MVKEETSLREFILERDAKSAFMIKKVVDEIVLAKARRESDGTYSG